MEQTPDQLHKAAVNKKWRMANQDRIKKEHRAYYLANREKCCNRSKVYCAKHREERRRYAKLYRATHQQYLKDYRLKNKEEVSRYRVAYERKRNYGMSQKQFDIMLKKQSGACAICKKPETAQYRGKPRRLSVDHDHSTKKIRGLLCSRCNLGIGLFMHNKDLLEKAILYL